MQRTLEPELMNDPEQVLAFHAGSRDYGIQGFIEMYKKYVDICDGSIVDLGSGTGAYLFALEKEYPNLRITGYDGSDPMVKIAKNIAEVSKSKIKFHLCNFNDIDDAADCVISTNTLHHIHNPEIFWNSAKRLSNRVFVMDLVRPPNEEIAKHIVDSFSKNDSEKFKSDYYNSLLAAFSIEELENQIKDTNLDLVVEGNCDFLQIAIIHGNL